MPQIRVYATDSYTALVTTRVEGSSFEASIATDGHRGPSLDMGSNYEFFVGKPAMADTTHAEAAVISFDLTTIPQLRGRRITGITGPFARLTRCWTSLYTNPAGQLDYWSDYTRYPFFQFLDYYPSPTHIAQINRLGAAAIGSFLDLSEKDNLFTLHNGVFRSESCAFLHCYPKEMKKEYIGFAYAVFDSHASQNPPYIEVSYTDTTIEAINCAPLSGFLNEQAVNRFSWALAIFGTNTVGGVSPVGANFEWRIKGQTSTQMEHITSSDTYIDFPAGSFPNGEIQWRVMVLGDNGQRSAFTGWYSLTTIDAVALPPDSLTPDGAFLDGTQAISLGWRHNSPLATASAGFEIQICGPDGAWQELTGRINSSESRYLVPPGRLPGGGVLWRVRDCTSDGVLSSYSASAHLTVRAASPPPVFRQIDATSNRPLVSWLSQEQLAYELVVYEGEEERYHSGTLPGGDTALRLPVFLENGRYLFSLRTQNSFGLWSRSAQLEALINAKSRLSLTLAGEGVKNGVTLDFEVEVLS